MIDWLVNIIKEMAFFGINGYRKILYRIFSLFPINPKRIFVNCFDGKGFGDNPKYILIELNKLNNNLEFCWVLKKKTNSEDCNINLKYCKPFSIRAIYLQATSKIWISTVRMPYYSIKREGQFYYHTWHAGIALKKVEQECEASLSPRYKRTAHNDSKMIDYYISDNDDNTNLYKNYFWYCGGEILKYGSPRNDLLIRNSANDVQVIRNKYNISSKFRVCLYAPTFRKDGSLKCYDIDFQSLKKVLERKFGGEWIIIIRLHPRLENKANTYISYNSWLINGSSINDIQEVLLITDVLITDYSSISLDFINTQRPIFIYANDIEDYKKDRDFHISLAQLPFSISKSNIELKENIESFDLESFRMEVMLFMKKYQYYGNGFSSNKVAEHINNQLNNN